MAGKYSDTFDGILKDIKNKNYAPVYLLMGDESYFIDKISDSIEKDILLAEECDFNLSVMFGADVTSSNVADMAREFPIMSERRVVILKEAQNIRDWTGLENYLKNPSPQTVLAICFKNGVFDKRKKIFGLIKNMGVVFESKKKKDYELPGFINAFLKGRGFSIDNKSASMIAENIGSDLNRLTGELEKLILSLGNGDTRITPEIVESRIGVSKDFNSFELKNAIINRNVFKANQIINYFDKNPKAGSIYSSLPLLFNYFQNLMIAYYTPGEKNEKTVAAWLDLRAEWAAKDYITGMKNFKGVKVMQIISKIREMDAKSKGIGNPNTEEGELMRELIFFILH